MGARQELAEAADLAEVHAAALPVHARHGHATSPGDEGADELARVHLGPEGDVGKHHTGVREELEALQLRADGGVG